MGNDYPNVIIDQQTVLEYGVPLVNPLKCLKLNYDLGNPNFVFSTRNCSKGK